VQLSSAHHLTRASSATALAGASGSRLNDTS
jgi:hypothetical protein